MSVRWNGPQNLAGDGPTDAKVRELLRERRATEALESRLAAIAEWGQDTYENGTVVAFNRTIRDNTYTYAAVKAGDHWYVTGAGPNRQPWDEFVLWLTQEGAPTTNFSVLFDPKVDEVTAIAATEDDTNK